MADDVAEDEEYEEQAIKYLFYRGFEYEEMRGLLFEEFGIKMSLSTLKRRLKALNLARKQCDNVKQVIEELLDGPHSCVGYLSILHESSAHFYIFKSSIKQIFYSLFFVFLVLGNAVRHFAYYGLSKGFQASSAYSNL